MRAFDRVITARLLKPRKVDVCDKRGLKTAKVLTRYDNTQSDMMPSRCLVTHHWTFCIFLRATNLPRSPFRLCFFWMTWQLSFNEVMLQYSKFLTDISHIWQIIKSFKNVYIPRAFLSKCQTKGWWSEAQSFQPIFFTLLYTLVHLSFMNDNSILGEQLLDWWQGDVHTRLAFKGLFEVCISCMKLEWLSSTHNKICHYKHGPSVRMSCCCLFLSLMLFFAAVWGENSVFVLSD